jgi:hypothetical protein
MRGTEFCQGATEIYDFRMQKFMLRFILTVMVLEKSSLRKSCFQDSVRILLKLFMRHLYNIKIVVTSQKNPRWRVLCFACIPTSSLQSIGFSLSVRWLVCLTSLPWTHLGLRVQILLHYHRNGATQDKESDGDRNDYMQQRHETFSEVSSSNQNVPLTLWDTRA